MEDIILYYGIVVGMFFPVLVFIFSKLINTKKSKLYVVFPLAILSLYFTGYELYNKKIEIFVISLAFIFLFVFLNQLSREIIPKLLKYIISTLYIVFNVLIGLIWIWGLGDYLSQPIFAKVDNEDFKIAYKVAGNFSDIQVLCELRQDFYENVIYKTVDSQLVKEVYIRDFNLIKELENGFQIEYNDNDKIILRK